MNTELEMMAVTGRGEQTMVTTLIVVVVCFVFWLLPLYWVCKYAERERKDERVVFLVGLLTSWLIALFVTLLLPKKSDEEWEAAHRSKEAKSGDDGMLVIVLSGVGVALVGALALVGWIMWGM